MQLHAGCENMMGFARLELIQVIAVIMLQARYEDMVSIAQLECIEVIVIASEEVSQQRSLFC